MKRLSFFLLTVLLFGCGGGGGDGLLTPGGNDKVLAKVVIADGNNQTATVGTELAKPLVALLLNQSGSPIAGFVVNFKVVTGGGSVFAGAAISDNNGIVRERWTLGTVAGPQKVEVRAVDATGAAVVYATFDATAVADAPKSLSIFSGNGQQGSQLQPLPSPVMVVVKDTYGNPVAGVEVTFTPLTSNFGTVNPVTAITNVAGVAATSWTLGLAVGSQSLGAVAIGLPPVYFGASATQVIPSEAAAITKFQGDLATIEQHTTSELYVTVTDQFQNVFPGAQVVFSAAPGSGYVTPKTVTTDEVGRARWFGYFHTAGQQKVDAVVAGTTLKVTFDITVTPTNHPFDGSYACTSEPPTSFPLCMEVVEGVLGAGSTGGTCLFGTFSETDGIITEAKMRGGYASGLWVNLSGQLALNSLNQAMGTGSYYETDYGVPTGKNGTWTCTRR